jgi:hypothetical protein
MMPAVPAKAEDQAEYRQSRYNSQIYNRQNTAGAD